jgi:hypothetical protein
MRYLTVTSGDPETCVFENKFSIEGFLATVHRTVSPQLRRLVDC